VLILASNGYVAAAQRAPYASIQISRGVVAF
jgi:hypothetical protein